MANQIKIMTTATPVKVISRNQKPIAMMTMRIWSHLLKKSLMEIFVFCAVKGV